MKRTMPFLMLLALGCGASSKPPEIEIPFALLATDELQAVSMMPCSYTPITGTSRPSRSNGLLELDPAVNPSPSYALAVQVENFAGPSPPVGAGGLFQTTSNDFLVGQAVVTYRAQQSFLAPNVPPQAIVSASGRISPGGALAAGATVVQTLDAEVIGAVTQNLSARGPGAAGDLLLGIQLQGTLASGEPAVSNVFDFTLHVCLDCGANPLSCVNGVTAAPSGHGPCCAPQDFFDVCVPCGGVGEPCCAPPATVPATCSRDTDCQRAYGASSSCDDAGVCTPGCNADPGGKPLACALATRLPSGAELCGYPNSGGLDTVCASP